MGAIAPACGGPRGRAGKGGFGGAVPYDVTEDAAPVLERDMTMIIHPNQYIPETGYMMLGDTVVIERVTSVAPPPSSVIARR